MLPAIDLNDEPMRRAGEVGDPVADRHLTSEAQAGDLAIADRVPQTLLSFRGIGT